MRVAQKLSAARSQKFAPGMIQGTGAHHRRRLDRQFPRVLPKNCDAVIETKELEGASHLPNPASKGKVDRAEMYQVFNMGIGMVGDRFSARRQEKRCSNPGSETDRPIERGTGKTSSSW